MCICVPVLEISVLIAEAKMSLTNRQGCSPFKGGDVALTVTVVYSSFVVAPIGCEGSMLVPCFFVCFLVPFLV